MNFIIRKADVKDLRQISYVHVDSWRETYPGIVSQDVLNKLSYGKSLENWKFCYERSTQHFYVAEINGIIAGFAVGGPSRDAELLYDAEIYALYVLQKYQKLGIGKALVQKLAEEFQKENWKDFLIWCLLKNKACGFYEKLGAKHEETKKIRIVDKPLIEHGYVFDIEKFLKREAEPEI
ncbi:MAG: GNAT family N-acetyltransferase [Candidatus Cloacimonetes bacterium]|nr:GNAT family N-acetyltransferase [Candidatus Cloacimonadota bacterium]